MKLRHLFLSLSLLLSIVVVMMTMEVVRSTWQEVRDVERGQEALQQLQAMLHAKEMASRERGPSNGVLGDDVVGGDPAKLERLRAARLKTDQALEALLHSIAITKQPSPQLSHAVAQAQVQLTQARQRIDTTAKRELNTRTAADIRGAIGEMIEVIHLLDSPTLQLTNQAQAIFHGATDILAAANLAAILREYAGQLGSHFTAPIAKRRTLTDLERTTIERIRGRIEQLGQQLMQRTATVDTQSPAQQSYQTMYKRYFGSALAFIDTQMAVGLRDGQYGIDTAGFAARYVPDMDAIVTLRNVLMEQVQTHATKEMREAQQMLWWVSSLALLIMVILGSTLWLVHRRVARPLERTTALITAIAQGQLDLQVPQSQHHDELADILKAVAVLRDNSQARLVAEQERSDLFKKLAEQNNYLQLNNRLLQRLSDGTPLHELLDYLMRGIEQAHPTALCTVLLASPDGTTLHHAAAPSMPDFWKQLMRIVPIAEGVGSCGTAAYRKERVMVADVQTDPLWVNFRTEAQRAGLRSCWSQPLLNVQGQILGTFAIYYTKVALPNEQEVHFIENHAKLVCVAIERSRLAEALQSSQALYQMIADNSNDIITVVDLPSLRYSYISPSVERTSGFTPQELLGQSITTLMGPEAEVAVNTMIDALLSEADSAARTLIFEHLIVCKDGHSIYVEVVSKIIFDSDNNPIQAISSSRDISKRKIAEEALAAERLFLQNLLDHSPVKIGFVSDNHIRFANKKLIENFGVQYGDRSDSSYVHPEDFEQIRTIIQRDGNLVGYEVQMYNRNREVRDILATFISTAYSGNKGVMAWLEDITEKKATARQLADQRKAMQNLLEYSPVGTAISTQGVFQYTNPAFIKLFDVHVGEHAQAIYLQPEDRVKILQRLGCNGYILNQEMKMCGSDGRVIDCLASFSTTVYNGIDGLMVWILDITDRKRAEEAVYQASRYARSLLEASLDPLVTISPDGKITDVNHATEMATGLNREQLIGTEFSEYFTDPNAAKEGYRKVFEDGSVKDYPLALKHQAGAIIDVLYNASVYFNEHGEVDGIFAAARDITERKKAEEVIRAMAFFDKLTGLPNRRMLEDRMQQLIARAKREKAKLSVLFIDLDKFKQVNDTHGHEVGDWLLQEVSRRLTSCLRATDTASRIGGDEFVVVLPDAKTVDGAVLVAEKIRIEMEKPFAMSETLALDISSSIGVVMYPDQADNPRDLLRFGDEAMYKAKKRGRNAVEVFAIDKQMLRLMWKSDYECGNEIITREHKRLFELANTLIDMATRKDFPPESVDQALDACINHIREHFEHEDAILREYHYPNQEHHAQEHHTILEKAEALRHQRQDGKVPLGQLLDFLVFEVVGKHMEGDDVEFFYLFDPSTCTSQHSK